MKYKIFVISLLENNFKRRSSVEKQLNGLVDFEFVDAVLGSEINKENDERIGKDAYWLRAGQIGCALSHLNCYKKIIDQDLDFAIILEDDFCVKDEAIFDFSKDIYHTITNESTVLSYYVTTFPEEQLSLKKESDSFYRLTGGRPLMAISYLINKKACEEFLSKAYPLISVADDWPRFINLGIVQKFMVQYPFPIIPDNFESQIGYSPKGRKQKIIHFLKTKLGISLYSYFKSKKKYMVFEEE